jgi:dTDP-4-dehydrorhamnose 3,5-epimerase
MNVIKTRLPDVLIIEPKVFGDSRGFFFESFNARTFAAATGLNPMFVQDNHSRSTKHVLRGLHYQIRRPQGKLVRVVCGEVFDVAVDLRKSSPNFGKWTGTILSEQNKHMMWIPPGFAHGFVVLNDSADLQYKTTEYYAPEHERCIAWNDAKIHVDWPLTGEPILATKDIAGSRFEDAEVFD